MPPVKGTATGTKPAGLTVAKILTLDEILALGELAKIYFEARILPSGVGKVQQLHAIMIAGREVGLTPTQAVANSYINEAKSGTSRICFYGDAAIALVRGSGKLESISECVYGSDDDRMGICEVKRVGEEARKFTFELAIAKKMGLLSKKFSPWESDPDRMLIMRARSRALRDVFADVLGGIGIGEGPGDTDEPAPAEGEVGGNNEATTAKRARKAKDIAEAVKESETLSATTVSTPIVSETVQQPTPPAAVTPSTNGSTIKAFTEITEKQLETMALCRSQYLLFVAKTPAGDRAAEKAAWAKRLSAYGIESVKGISTELADKILAEIKAEVDKNSVFSAAA